jgi:hypothetical protein
MTALKSYIAKRTLRIRQKLVRFMVPKVTVSWQTIENYIARSPRPMILFAKKYFKESPALIGVEIGVDKADNSLSILEELTLEKLYLIDPYPPYEDDNRPRSLDVHIAKNKVKEYQNKIVWLIKGSDCASQEFAKETLDFVYIDGGHNYENVKNDIKLYYPLIKNNGLIGGHDYTPLFEFDVIRAVKEFAEQSGLELHTDFPDWWFIVKHPLNQKEAKSKEIQNQV